MLELHKRDGWTQQLGSSYITTTALKCLAKLPLFVQNSSDSMHCSKRGHTKINLIRQLQRHCQKSVTVMRPQGCWAVDSWLAVGQRCQCNMITLCTAKSRHQRFIGLCLRVCVFV